MVIAWNAPALQGLLYAELQRAAVKQPTAFLGIASWHCAMEQAAAWYNTWDRALLRYAYPELGGGQQPLSALSVAHAVRTLLYQMAAST